MQSKQMYLVTHRVCARANYRRKKVKGLELIGIDDIGFNLLKSKGF